MIKIKNLKFKYRESDFELKIPSLEIEQGQKIAVIGPQWIRKNNASLFDVRDIVSG